MFRYILLALLGLYLIAVGIWPAAAAPVSLLFAGLAVLVGLIPGPVWLLAIGAAWLALKHQPAPKTATA
jgi:hypothetical protein